MYRRITLGISLLIALQARGQDGIATNLAPIASSAGHGSAGSQIVNVDLYTGTGNVTIPIHNNTVEGLDAGVSLTYDAKGTKVDQIYTSIGLGWTLNAGGSIFRETHGLEDDVIVNPNADTTMPSRIYGKWSQKNLNSGGEGELDEFTAVFCGRTIKFNMDYYQVSAGSPKIFTYRVFPRCNVQIIRTVENVDPAYAPGAHAEKNLTAFEIIDEQGNHFYFKKGDSKLASYESPSKSNSYLYYPISRWIMTKVVTKSGGIINYEYLPVVASYPQYKLQRVKENTLDGSTAPEVLDDKVIKWSGTMSQLKKISYPNGVTVDFIYDMFASVSYEYPLKNIKVTQALGADLANRVTYNLNQSFFQSPWRSFTASEIPYADYNGLSSFYNQSDADSVKTQIALGLRLKLNSITVTGTDGTTTEPYYKFDYNSRQLPRRFSSSQDYYGYYNGKQPVYNYSSGTYVNALSNMCIPLHSFTKNGTTYCSYGTDRTPDFSFMSACVLTKVTNASNGKISLWYDNHNLYNPDNGYFGLVTYSSPNDYPVYPPTQGEDANDGLRIAKVVYEDGFNEEHTTETRYQYSDGQRFFRGGYFYKVDYFAQNDQAPKTYQNFFANPIMFYNGSNHGYSYVEVSNYGSNNQYQGTSKYHFTNLMLPTNPAKSNLLMPGKNTNYLVQDPPYYMYQYRMGQLLDVETRNFNSDLISKSVYTYADSFMRPAPAHYASFSSLILDASGVSTCTYFFGIPYRLAQTTDITLTNNGEFSKQTSYAYNTQGNLFETKWTDDKRQLNIKRQTYTGNLPSATTLLREVNSQEKVVDYNGLTFVGTSPNLRLANSFKILNNDLIDVTDIPTAVRTTEEQTLFDPQGNVLESRKLIEDEYCATIFDTRIGRKIATVSNARFDEVAYSSFEGNFEPLGTNDPNKGNWDFLPSAVVYLIPGVSNQPMTGHYYYDLGNMGSISSKNALQGGKSFTLSLWATEPPIVTGSASSVAFKVHNQVGDWKFYTAEIIGNSQQLRISKGGISNSTRIDELRLFPSDAIMTTTTYEPLYGPSATCDATGNIVYTEYDVMGRPTVVRDINRNVLTVTKHVINGLDSY